VLFRSIDGPVLSDDETLLEVEAKLVEAVAPPK